MSRVVYLCRQHVEIDAGTVTESSNPVLIGQHRFFLTYVDEEGGRLCVWDGEHHDDAVSAAKEWALPVINRSGRQQ